MFAKAVLDSGIRVLTQEMAGVRSVSLGIWVENGSRHERPHQSGISHFVEHLLFKGTEQRTAAKIAEEMDSVGGVLNAFTGKEYTCYYAKVLDENLPMAVDLLTDIFLHSTFDREEIERERSVILQEISQTEDTPDDYVHELFSLNFFRDHPLGRPICGGAETVGRFQREDFMNLVRSRYLPHRVIVSAAGHLAHQELVSEIGRRLGGKDLSAAGGGREADPGGLEIPAPQSGAFFHTKPLEQVHLCLGVRGLPQSDPRRYEAHVLNTILGGGMSSRLFQEIREKKGAVYSIYSFLTSFRDVGYLGIYAGTSLERVEEVVDLVLAQMRGMARGDILEEELTRAKNQLIGGMVLGLESTDSWMSHITRNEIYFGKDLSLEEISEGVRAVSLEGVVDLAQSAFEGDGKNLTLLGDFDKKSVNLKF